MTDATHAYDDIIDLPHHVSTRHPHMSRERRAAQFAPFAALTGYDDSVREAAQFNQEFGPDSRDYDVLEEIP